MNPSSNPEVIGIDLGGSAIKLGRFRQDGTCLQSLCVATPQPATPKAVLEVMAEAIASLSTDVAPLAASQRQVWSKPFDDKQDKEYKENKDVSLSQLTTDDYTRQRTISLTAGSATAAIGVGTPGPTDAEGRIARVAINLTDWHDVPLADWLEAKTGYPTVLANDANCAGLGEAWLGAGRRFRNLILLTLGTGVGGAIILDGKLFTGHQGAAGELGLITLNPDGPMCNSGNQGSLEQYLSIGAIRRRTGKEPAELGVLAREGDKFALEFWESYGCALGIGLASLIYVLTPEAIVIGGGVSASAEFFFPSALAEIERRVLPSSRAGLQLLRAELGNQAGMVGAAQLAWQKIEG